MCSRASRSSPSRRRSSPPATTTSGRSRAAATCSRRTINIFNISKINSEVRGGRRPRSRGFQEEIGESYFEYLAGLDDLVLIMDESHRYRASAGMRAINELKPVLGLELTATPFVETTRGPVPFQERDLRLSARQGDGRRLRQGAGGRHARELLTGGEVARDHRADQARRRRAAARECQGRVGDLRAPGRRTHRQAVHAGHRPRHDACRRADATDQVRALSSKAATRKRSSRSIPA